MKRLMTIVALTLIAVTPGPLVAQRPGTPVVSPTNRGAVAATPASTYFPERFDWQHKKAEEVGMDPARITEAIKVSVDRENPASKDLNIALAYAIMGDADDAIPLLERVLHENYASAITPAYLRVDPTYDRIRNDPRFQKLCQEKEP